MQLVRTARYLKDLKRIGASADDIARLEAAVVAELMAGDLVVGLRGIRKIRFGIGNRGKSGGGRAVYYVIVKDDTVVMLLAFTKSEQADLSPAQRRIVLALLEERADGD